LALGAPCIGQGNDASDGKGVGFIFAGILGGGENEVIAKPDQSDGLGGPSRVPWPSPASSPAPSFRFAMLLAGRDGKVGSIRME
jgi:hypothetical protein